MRFRNDSLRSQVPSLRSQGSIHFPLVIFHFSFFIGKLITAKTPSRQGAEFKTNGLNEHPDEIEIREGLETKLLLALLAL